MSTKAIRIFLAVLALLLAGFILLVTLTEKSDGAQELYDQLSFNVANRDILYYDDSHGGFFGDGAAVAVFKASTENSAVIKQSWRGNFADGQVLEILFGEGGVFQSRGFYLPENSLFYFKDFSSLHSLNFVFAVFNCESGEVYYCRFDT